MLLKRWSETFAEMLGNFQHNPERAHLLLSSLEEMTGYFREAVRRAAVTPGDGLLRALVIGKVDGDSLTEDEIVTNAILTMVGGQETTTNLIGNGLLTLIRHPGELTRLRADPALVPQAVEELLRYESPSQHTARVATEDTTIRDTPVRRGQAVIAVMGAANRDPGQFPDPDRLDLARSSNRHLAFGWAAHFCFGAGLARVEGQVAFTELLRRFLACAPSPAPSSGGRTWACAASANCG
ncbi:cytochrome P450 [Nonomuraea sp. NPDC050451]|uniref:cytochrome P450 n=1 Tax=Nonomuraea sp. NPDC050451 TaxID=3364364 RepID=UPI003795CAE9